MLKITTSTQFKKDLKKIENSKDNLIKTKEIILKLASNKKLSTKNKDHKLKGNFKNFRECHITPDLLLIYSIGVDYIFLSRLGTHSELFK